MRIMTLNCGSSSVKYAVFGMPDGIKLCQGTVDRVTIGGSFIEHYGSDRQKYRRYHECPTHAKAIELIINLLTDQKTDVIKTISEIKAVGHRVVHGGEKFKKPRPWLIPSSTL